MFKPTISLYQNNCDSFCLQIFGVIFSCCLVRKIKDKVYKYWKWSKLSKLPRGPSFIKSLDCACHTLEWQALKFCCNKMFYSVHVWCHVCKSVLLMGAECVISIFLIAIFYLINGIRVMWLMSREELMCILYSVKRILRFLMFIIKTIKFLQ